MSGGGHKRSSLPHARRQPGSPAPLAGDRGQAALEALAARRPLLAFDFDGTLAPIVDRPADARVPQPLSTRLAALSVRWPVAVVTGRAVADVLPRLRFEPRYVVGNHGAEDPHAPPVERDGAALDAMRAQLAAAAAALRDAGVSVEDKKHSLALHYRLAPDRRAALAAIDALLTPPPPGLRRFGGKCVVNLAAEDDPDKFDAVAALVERAGCDTALFAGDDVNDEAVFERAPSHWVTVRVGCDARASAARWCVGGTDEVAAMLDRLLAFSGRVDAAAAPRG